MLIGIFNNSAVAKPGAYVFIKNVTIKCGNIALKIIEPKKPMSATLLHLIRKTLKIEAH